MGCSVVEAPLLQDHWGDVGTLRDALSRPGQCEHGVKAQAYVDNAQIGPGSLPQRDWSRVR